MSSTSLTLGHTCREVDRLHLKLGDKSHNLRSVRNVGNKYKQREDVRWGGGGGPSGARGGGSGLLFHTEFRQHCVFSRMHVLLS